MLETDYHEQLNTLLADTEVRVELPVEYREVLASRGKVKLHADERRRFARRIFPLKAILEVKPTTSGIAREHGFHVIYTRDFSRGGIAFYHASELFPGERPILWLQPGKFMCTVVRCVRLNEDCYDIGATFHDVGDV